MEQIYTYNGHKELLRKRQH